jgi:hypothetical protein
MAGADLNTSTELALYPARSGAKVNLQIVFTAPNEPGSYQNAWQAYDPLGQSFGDLLYIQITVDSSKP